MRFYLDSAQPEEIRAAAGLLHVAGVTADREGLRRARMATMGQFLDAVTVTNRRDWKIWLQLGRGSLTALLDRAHELNEALVARTGGLLSGPTLVFMLPHDAQGLAAATILIREGVEVGLAAIANPVQALALSTLPEVSAHEGGLLVTEGPPASRNPHMPHALVCPVGKLEDKAQYGIKTVLKINDLLLATERRTRVLACDIRERETLDTLVRRLARRSRSVVDLSLPYALLAGAAQDRTTMATTENDGGEDLPL